MHVADCDRKSIGGIVRRRRLRKTEDEGDHALNLVFISTPVSHEGQLDLRGGVFGHGDSRLNGSEYRNAPGMTELQRASHVHRMEDVLDGDALGPALRERSG